ncbi:hypothetical protein CLV51_101258 [Chitinophaga niastensis]|uniref:N,N-dimethylformamidase beta subunit-like C-terminal domain-containing protein n=1 Tax=Chitinophaga niastensis TaxID=536980 RepID=A0A2P8HRV7_CHINA|nr:N,N-dimethylformamidase beta subunit family domain-containing protein [Chitinophaga niastensis]PSL48928.1 hypothetical protein CLV51_101258 [Chitinophaga niastensis]
MFRLKFNQTVVLTLLSIAAIIYSCKKSSDIQVEPPLPPGASPAIRDAGVLNGYPDKMSYYPGDSAGLFTSTDSTYQNRSIRVYDMEGKVSFVINAEKSYNQSPQGESPSEEGFKYEHPIRFMIPANTKTGVYLIANKIPFVVKSKEENVDFTVVYPSNTENAYCESGRRSLYTLPVAKMVSFLRPIRFSEYGGPGFLKWMLKQNYNYNVICDEDLEDYKNIKGKILIIIGHSEYWTRPGRRNFDRFVAEGHHALILSGNVMWWQVRIDATKRQLICYKGLGEPPVADSLKTIYWKESKLKYPIISSIGCDFDGGGYGTIAKNEGWEGFKITSPNSPLFAGLHLKKGDIIRCPSREYDGAPLTGYDAEGVPVLNTKAMKFEKVELVGFDFAFRTVKTVPTAIVFKKTKTSGIVVNFPTTDWCTSHNFSLPKIADITANAINGLLKDQNMFSN